MEKEQRLTRHEVSRVSDSFWVHIAQNWDNYLQKLPNLRRTMMVYNEFAYGIRNLPENRHGRIEFNPKHPILEDLPRFFKERYNDQIGDFVYGAWPLRVEFSPWKGYAEPIEDTPEALQQHYPDLFQSVEEAQIYMFHGLGTGYGWFDGQRVQLTAVDTVPEFWFKGFTTVEEFSNQRIFLDKIRNHPRIKLGIERMERFYQKLQIDHQEKERLNKLMNEKLNSILTNEGKVDAQEILELFKKVSEIEGRKHEYD